MALKPFLSKDDARDALLARELNVESLLHKLCT